MLMDLLRYFAAVVIDGDWLNDWLTYLPEAIQPDIIEMGKAIADMFGS